MRVILKLGEVNWASLEPENGYEETAQQNASAANSELKN